MPLFQSLLTSHHQFLPTVLKELSPWPWEEEPGPRVLVGSWSGAVAALWSGSGPAGQPPVFLCLHL